MDSTHSPRHTAADHSAGPQGPPWYQLIDGQFRMEESPSRGHQDVSRNLVFALLTYLRERPIGRLYYAPFDVVLDDFNVFHPDILVILNSRRSILTERGACGAPDLVIEILSPSTRRLDVGHKKKVYEHAGVGEMWVVDPDGRCIMTFDFAPEEDFGARSWKTGQTMTSKLLPGFSLPLASVFAG